MSDSEGRGFQVRWQIRDCLFVGESESGNTDYILKRETGELNNSQKK